MPENSSFAQELAQEQLEHFKTVDQGIEEVRREFDDAQEKLKVLHSKRENIVAATIYLLHDSLTAEMDSDTVEQLTALAGLRRTRRGHCKPGKPLSYTELTQQTD